MCAVVCFVYYYVFSCCDMLCKCKLETTRILKVSIQIKQDLDYLLVN